MAKKVVATLQNKSGKKFVKCIKMVKEGRNDSYVYQEEMLLNDQTKNFFS